MCKWVTAPVSWMTGTTNTFMVPYLIVESIHCFECSCMFLKECKEADVCSSTCLSLHFWSECSVVSVANMKVKLFWNELEANVSKCSVCEWAHGRNLFCVTVDFSYYDSLRMYGKYLYTHAIYVEYEWKIIRSREGMKHDESRFFEDWGNLQDLIMSSI